MKKQWFLDRIGKVVFREDNGCNCWVCQVSYRDGILIKNVERAEYLHELGYHYFDTKQERDNFVANGTKLTP